MVRKFAIYSIATMIILGAILGFDLNNTIKETAIWLFKQQIKAQQLPLMRDHINSTDFAAIPAPRRLAELDNFFNAYLASNQVLLIKLWNSQGMIVYSTDHKYIGKQEPNNPDIKTALSGQIIAEFTDDYSATAHAEAAGLTKNYQELIEVYLPIEINGKITGIYEAYWNTEELFAKLKQVALSVWGLIGASFFILFIVQYRIVFGAANTISHQKNELDRIEKRLIRSLSEQQQIYRGTIQSLLAALDAKDHYTAGHSLRVADYALLLGKKIGLPAERLRILEEAALFHDIGKIGIPEHLLGKPTDLTKEEYAAMQTHVRISSQIIGVMDGFSQQARIILHHHEHWDGSGYPVGLAGKAIPLESRILAIADTYDALTTDRPYRKGLSRDEALLRLAAASGTQFDPELTELFIAIIQKK
ncbi:MULTISPECIES: HD-GYP domain-containing protein [Carboxydocella]|uniref:HD domain-containing protein n=2 Tax=Carboxydocella TaxID=178898 RepID=A0A1T4LBM6_9FIRM|nr:MULTISPECIES: HD-GYP domain-containing protein [Carboxydocella]AVX19856.1 HD domain-containing protein [Carboxydocella thermautotrophica]AVX30265.1 HD domain-containing protein [Carboxydocella thermautotrophica]SJZ52232.1 HD domain-containing protein [Carboxydocella sporoproducens DSM 16521]GAW28681.1 HDIG domain-containing protein [Carboxydocella sp. ULO1]GAW30526.1 HDIG domain-containing protein [Carboxydocella sp. JDF658]